MKRQLSAVWRRESAPFLTTNVVQGRRTDCPGLLECGQPQPSPCDGRAPSPREEAQYRYFSARTCNKIVHSKVSMAAAAAIFRSSVYNQRKLLERWSRVMKRKMIYMIYRVSSVFIKAPQLFGTYHRIVKPPTRESAVILFLSYRRTFYQVVRL